MYQRSGGTTPFKTCGECSNFCEFHNRNKKYFKCEIYGVTASEATDWRKSWVACKYFNSDPPEIPLVKTRRGGRRKKNENVTGQLSLIEFM